MRLTYFVRANTLDFHIISVEYSLFHPDVPSIQKNTPSLPLMYLHGILLPPKPLDCAIMHCRIAAKFHSRAGYLRCAIFHQALWTRGGLQTYKHKQTEKAKSCHPQKKLCVSTEKSGFQGLKPPAPQAVTDNGSTYRSRIIYRQFWICVSSVSCWCPRQCLPVSTSPLWCQFHAINRVVAVIIHDLGKSKIGDFYLSTCSTID